MTTVRQFIMTVLATELQRYHIEWVDALVDSFDFDRASPSVQDTARANVNRAVNCLVIVFGDKLLYEPGTCNDREEVVRSLWNLYTCLPSSFHRLLQTARARDWGRSHGLTGILQIENN